MDGNITDASGHCKGGDMHNPGTSRVGDLIVTISNKKGNLCSKPFISDNRNLHTKSKTNILFSITTSMVFKKN